jgi:dTDP-glucose 4,6-dehydratase/UDP-glucose 4-epimerase
VLKTLVIGSNGFIGSSLYNYFSNLYDVFGADIAEGEFTQYVIDESNPDFEELFSKYQFGLCINCAGSANVSKSFTATYNDFNLNTNLVAKIAASICHYNKNCQIVNISSAAVYGNPVSIPVNVDTKPLPLSPYGSHKLLSEILISDYFKMLGLRGCSIRIFSAYGVGQKKLLLWDLFQKFHTNDSSNTIELFGTGNESRDFIYIDDIIQQINLILKNGNFRGEVYNVANGAEITIRQVAETMREILNSKKQINFNGCIRPGDALNWKADISQFNDWGYSQTISLSYGIELYCNWLLGLPHD